MTFTPPSSRRNAFRVTRRSGPGRRRVVAFLVAAVTGALALMPSAVSAAAAPISTPVALPPAEIHWQRCPDYSPLTLRYLVGPDELAEFTALWARTECGTVEVPMDYLHPTGRKVEVALTRLRATDPSRRLGSLAVNPGGPGASGYLMPLDLVIAHRNGNGAKLIQRYDLIGFDPRGVGYSSHVNCLPPTSAPPVHAPGPPTEAFAEAQYDLMKEQNAACVRTDPAFLAQENTTNVARDLDQIREGLHEPTISFLGVSWGTLLGAEYRSLFPDRVQRMWLDSPAPPWVRMDDYEADRQQATAADFGRFATWLAARNKQFGFGRNASEVASTLTSLRQRLDTVPETFTDLPGLVIDGSIIAQTAAQFSLTWPLGGPLLVALRDAPSGGPAPAAVLRAFGPPPADAGPPPPADPPADLPEEMNPTAATALLCTEDTGRQDFASSWAAYSERLQLYPVTAESGTPVAPCAGWDLPVTPLHLRHTKASMVMSVHRWEPVSPSPWGKQLRAVVGGQIVAVNDDVHSSTVGMASDCAPDVATYFFTGRVSRNSCQGVPVPQD